MFLFGFAFFKKLCSGSHSVKFTILAILSAQVSGIKYVYIVIQLSPLSIPRTLHLVKLSLCPH